MDELFIQNIPLENILQCKLLKKIYIYKNIAFTMRQGIIFAEWFPYKIFEMNDKKKKTNERTLIRAWQIQTRTKLLDFDWKYCDINKHKWISNSVIVITKKS